MIVKTDFRRVDNKRLNDLVRIGFYDKEKNCIKVVAEYRNYNNHSGINDGFLIVNTWVMNEIISAHQKGNNFAGGYNKPIANLEECLYCFSDKFEKITGRKMSVNSCGSINSLMTDFMNFLQSEYKPKLFLETII